MEGIHGFGHTDLRLARLLLIGLAMAVLLAGQPATAAAEAEAEDQADAGETFLLEGFEKLEAVKADGGAVQAVKGGAAVTEGKQAIQLPPGVGVRVTIRAVDVGTMEWLKLDTATADPLPAQLEISFHDRRRRFFRHAHLQAGKDTLAMPLSFVRGGRGDRFTEGSFRMEIRNAGQRPCMIDNLRVQRAAAPPTGSVLLDFGPGHQVVWPGFAKAGPINSYLAWSGRNEVYPMNEGRVPDPIGWDGVGPRLLARVADQAELRCPDQRGIAHLWITHYGYNYVQPTEYIAKAGSRTLLRERLAGRRYLGPEGLLLGKEGQWTPQWLDEHLAPLLVSRVEVPLTSRKTPLSLGNCQIAAVAMADVKHRQELAAYLKIVDRDVSRFRRQWLLGARHEARTDLVPTEAEQAQGVIFFRPPLNKALQADWTPDIVDRAEKLELTVAAGGSVLVPLVIAPLEKTVGLTVSAGTFKAEGRGAVDFDPKQTEGWFLDTVPVVRRGVAMMQPWVLSGHSPRRQGGQLLWALVRLAPQGNTRSGVYQGEIRITGPGVKASLPVNLDVRNLGPSETRPQMTLGGRSLGSVGPFYRAMSSELSDAARERMGLRLMEQFIEEGFTAWQAPTVGLDGELRAHVSGFRDVMQNLARFRPRGHMLLDLGGVFNRLRREDVPFGTVRYAEKLGSVVSQTVKQARQATENFSILVGQVWRDDHVDGVLRRAQAVQRAGGATAILASMRALEGIKPEQVPAKLDAVNVLLLRPDRARVPALAEAFLKLPGRQLYLYGSRPTRYVAGLFSAGVGGQGAYFDSLASDRGPYNGFHFDGSGVLIVQPDGSFVPTASMVLLRQGVADGALVHRCRDLLKARGKDHPAEAAELTRALAELNRATGAGGAWLDAETLANTQMPPQEIQHWCDRLTRLAGKLAAAGKKAAQ